MVPDERRVCAAWRRAMRAAKVAGSSIRLDAQFALGILRDPQTVISNLWFEHCCPKAVREDEDVIRLRVQKDGNALGLLDREYLLDHPELCWDAVKATGRAIKHVPTEILGKDSTGFRIASLKQDPAGVCKKDRLVQSSFELMRDHVLPRDGTLLRYASADLRDSRELATIALNHANPEKATCGADHNDDSSWLRKSCRKVLLCISDRLYRDREIALVAVQKSGESLRDLHSEFRDDESIVMAALQENPMALEFASQRLRSDPRVVSLAVKKNPKAFMYSDGEARSSRELIALVAKFDVFYVFCQKRDSASSYGLDLERQGRDDDILWESDSSSVNLEKAESTDDEMD
ncbi:unnamed protein product [Amoebophrya sp. A25]|nr:unnamed protein product [Amoebophrya sp. A25]|eukprot:GSA25T00019077001.1